MDRFYGVHPSVHVSVPPGDAGSEIEIPILELLPFVVKSMDQRTLAAARRVLLNLHYECLPDLIKSCGMV
jgi:hypothetical protein